MLNKNYLYLEICSTEDQMIDGHRLKGVHKVDRPMIIHTNAGKSKTDRIGYLGETALWLDEQGIPNVVPLKTLESKFHITYDSKKQGGAFICMMPEGKIVLD